MVVMAEDGAFTCQAIYQGYMASKASYRRQDGFQPDSGFVHLAVEDVKKLVVHPPEVQWQAVNGFEFDGGLDIRTWERFKSRATTTADRPPAPEPKGQGVNLFGDLVLRQLEYPSGKLVEEMRYSKVYVDLGMTEVTDDLANILSHEEGDIQVNLTDIRRYYPHYGHFYGRINCRHKTGAWDRESIRENGKPWDFSDVVEFLFSQLVGSPAVHRESDLFVEIVDPPMGLEGQGEPAVEVLQRLLDRFGFKGQMLPSGNWAVNRSFSRRLGRQSVAIDVRKPRDVEEIISYERLSSQPTDRPPAVVCVGPRRIMRATVLCVAVIRDPSDGLYYRIEDAVARMDYTMEELNEQVFNRSEARFKNVRPSDQQTQEARRLYQERRAAFQRAYQLYLPAFLFPNRGLGVDLESPSFSTLPFLPMVPTAWYKSELSSIRTKHPFPKEGGKGDLEEFTLLPPVVRGHYVGDDFFVDFKRVQQAFDAQIDGLTALIQAHEASKGEFERKAKAAGEDLLACERVSLKTKSASELARFGILDGGALEIGEDVAKALANVGQVVPRSDRIKSTTQSQAALEALKAYTDLVAYAQEKIQEPTTLIGDLKKNFALFKAAYSERRGFHCRMNKPQQVLAGVRVDPETGLVESGEPLCQVTRPIFFDGDDEVVGMDGAVTITFGYELKGSGMASYTNYLFIADDGGDPDKVAEVKFAGCHRSSPLKAKVVPIESREYLQDNGNPMNWNACWSEAKAKATAQLALPRRVNGWTLELHGLRHVVLDAGTIAVHHEWDGDVGMTYVSVNHPGANLPWSPAGMRPQRPTTAADWRERWQREDGDGRGF